MTLVYHYTSISQHLPLILESVELRPSNAGGREDEPALLWFSRDRIWEPTAGKAVLHRGKIKLLNMRQQHESYGCARFGIAEDDPRLMEWREALASTPALGVTSVGPWSATARSAAATRLIGWLCRRQSPSAR
ncbi:hypothetical protein K2E96_02115 [Pseudomonas sp. ERGC3:05]|nr:hypothetical protein K2E96_02115 [Pseudomonas sp. ERGC3:05]